MNNIYITGFMSCGKSVTSYELSRLLQRELFDTDVMIEKQTNMKITDIFENNGEEYFRELEKQTLSRLSLKSELVVSTGGGIILSPHNRALMHASGIIVALLPDFSIIESRLEKARVTRPLLAEDISAVRKRFNDRLPFYKDCDLEVHPDKSMKPLDIAWEIIKRIDG